jgi:hypothetical protein
MTTIVLSMRERSIIGSYASFTQASERRQKLSHVFLLNPELAKLSKQRDRAGRTRTNARLDQRLYRGTLSHPISCSMLKDSKAHAEHETQCGHLSPFLLTAGIFPFAVRDIANPTLTHKNVIGTADESLLKTWGIVTASLVYHHGISRYTTEGFAMGS